jgi:hypothetical protein
MTETSSAYAGTGPGPWKGFTKIPYFNGKCNRTHIYEKLTNKYNLVWRDMINSTYPAAVKNLKDHKKKKNDMQP